MTKGRTQFISLAVALDDAAITTADYAVPDRNFRVINLDIGRLSLMCGGRTDAETFDNLARLIDAATVLRDAADARLRAAEAVAS